MEIGKIRVKNREPLPFYAGMEMDPQERESEMGEESPVVSQWMIFLVLCSMYHLLEKLNQNIPKDNNKLVKCVEIIA